MKPEKNKDNTTKNLQEILGEKVPFTISELVVQKGDPGRVSVFSGSGFVFGIPLAEAHRLGLHKGSEVTETLIGPICESLENDRARNYLLKTLARRPYSRQQLASRLLAKGFPENSAEQVLDVFEQKGWIDDEAYAKAYASDKMRFSGWGPHKIRLHLKKDGVKDPVIARVLDGMASRIAAGNVLEQLVVKRRLHFLREKDTFKRKKKIVDYLLGKGFTREDVFGHITTLMEVLDR